MLLAQVAYPLLPTPSPLDFYFLESPWQLLALTMVCGLVLLYQANQVRSRRFMYWGFACIALGVALLVLATCVTTQREALTSKTENLIAHTAPLNASGIFPFLTPDCAFYAGPQDSNPSFTVKEKVDTVLKSKIADMIGAQTIVRLDVSIDTPSTARSQLWLKTYIKTPLLGSGESVPISTRWELQWVLSDHLWKVASLRLLEKD